jgi:hypothetical protein
MINLVDAGHAARAAVNGAARSAPWRRGSRSAPRSGHATDAPEREDMTVANSRPCGDVVWAELCIGLGDVGCAVGRVCAAS